MTTVVFLMAFLLISFLNMLVPGLYESNCVQMDIWSCKKNWIHLVFQAWMMHIFCLGTHLALRVGLIHFLQSKYSEGFLIATWINVSLKTSQNLLLNFLVRGLLCSSDGGLSLLVDHLESIIFQQYIIFLTKQMDM